MNTAMYLMITFRVPKRRLKSAWEHIVDNIRMMILHCECKHPRTG